MWTIKGQKFWLKMDEVNLDHLNDWQTISESGRESMKLNDTKIGRSIKHKLHCKKGLKLDGLFQTNHTAIWAVYLNQSSSNLVHYLLWPFTLIQMAIWFDTRKLVHFRAPVHSKHRSFSSLVPPAFGLIILR